jgi:carboxypeptidase C (cathepsin A)
MLAFMQEHGPYLMDVGKTDFRKNDYSWNREANMLYIE